VNEPEQLEMPAAKAKAAAGWTFAAFREWREREHPRTSYQIGPRVWRPESHARIGAYACANQRAMKNWEPRLTGLAYADRDVYLVEVAAELSAESIGRVLYLVDLWQRDPDYAEHCIKRVHVVMIVREAAPSLLKFARRRRIRVVVLRADDEAGETTAPDSSDQVPAALAEVAKR
jgi:hypothetical protein